MTTTFWSRRSASEVRAEVVMQGEVADFRPHGCLRPLPRQPRSRADNRDGPRLKRFHLDTSQDADAGVSLEATRRLELCFVYLPAMHLRPQPIEQSDGI